MMKGDKMGKEDETMEVGRLEDLRGTLQSVENNLLHRALERSRGEAEAAFDFINTAAEAGVVDIECDGCGEEETD